MKKPLQNKITHYIKDKGLSPLKVKPIRWFILSPCSSTLESTWWFLTVQGQISVRRLDAIRVGISTFYDWHSVLFVIQFTNGIHGQGVRLVDEAKSCDQSWHNIRFLSFQLVMVNNSRWFPPLNFIEHRTIYLYNNKWTFPYMFQFRALPDLFAILLT